MPRKPSLPGQVRANAMCLQVTRFGSWVEMDMVGAARGLGAIPASISEVWLREGLAKGSDDMHSGTDTEVRRRCGGKCRMKQESGWSVSEWLPLTIAASPIRLPVRLLSQPADPSGASALPGGCRLLHQHQLSCHVPARPQARPHNLLRLLSILTL